MEAAVDMVQKLESNNGRSNVTMGGLMRPVNSAKEMEEIMMDRQRIRQIEDLNDHHHQHGGYCDDKIISTSSRGNGNTNTGAVLDLVEGTAYDVCACTITIGSEDDQSPDDHIAKIREPLTAPF
ncbi:hypothetical protein Syun_011468 [Stephania yunnanensis]|uniref:Uncharacterized protein n=1 Tax=Stephania yunnanensis TaxID=152371 RepID=A0AAP0JYU2_9MAGN